MNRLVDAQAQLAAVAGYFDKLGATMDRLPEIAPDTGDAALMPSVETT
jgi:hypothetical protein